MGTLTMLIARRLTGVHSFLTDFVSVDAKATQAFVAWRLRADQPGQSAYPSICSRILQAAKV